MAGTTEINAQSKEDWLLKFQDKEQKCANAMGLNIIEYYMQVENGLLKPTVLKLLRHAKAHPDTCPLDCAFQRSLNDRKEKYGVS